MDQIQAGLIAVGYDYQQNDQSLTVLGVSKHAKDASQGINAVIRLATVLDSIQSHPALTFLAKNGKPSWPDRWSDRDGENRDIT